MYAIIFAQKLRNDFMTSAVQSSFATEEPHACEPQDRSIAIFGKREECVSRTSMLQEKLPFGDHKLKKKLADGMNTGGQSTNHATCTAGHLKGGYGRSTCSGPAAP